jgi:hypothetical protein
LAVKIASLFNHLLHLMEYCYILWVVVRLEVYETPVGPRNDEKRFPSSSQIGRTMTETPTGGDQSPGAI